VVNKFPVVEPLLNDHMSHAQRQCPRGTWTESQVDIRLVAHGGFQGTDIDELRSTLQRIEIIDSQWGRRVERVGAPGNDATGFVQLRPARRTGCIAKIQDAGQVGSHIPGTGFGAVVG